MTDLLIGLAVLLMVGAAAFYLYKAKKSGKKCIGCPYANSCDSKESCNCNSDK